MNPEGMPGWAEFANAVAALAAARVESGVSLAEAVDAAMRELVARQHWQLAQTCGHCIRVDRDGFRETGWSPAGNAIVSLVAERVWHEVRKEQR